MDDDEMSMVVSYHIAVASQSLVITVAQSEYHVHLDPVTVEGACLTRANLQV